MKPTVSYVLQGISVDTSTEIIRGTIRRVLREERDARGRTVAAEEIGRDVGFTLPVYAWGRVCGVHPLERVELTGVPAGDVAGVARELLSGPEWAGREWAECTAWVRTHAGFRTARVAGDNIAPCGAMYYPHLGVVQVTEWWPSYYGGWGGTTTLSVGTTL